MDFYNTAIAPEAFKKVEETLKSTFISSGGVVNEFEKQLASKLSIVNPVTVNSGTSALHLALEVAGISEGDEVIIPPQTFVATGLAVLMAGGTPVFADIQADTGNISPQSLSEKITSKTKAIIPVHWAGYPCDMDEVNTIATNNNIAVIEDAAHALGATYKGNPIGALSRMTCFSFQAIKHLTTGDGGAICCLSESDTTLARNLRWFGIDRENCLPSPLGERIYDINRLGYKYHMNNFAAALGLGNLAEFERNLKRRKMIAQSYRNELSNVPGLNLLSYKGDRECAYWLFSILVENRLNFVKKLKESNIPTSVVHLRIDRNSVFGGITKGLTGQEEFEESHIAIPLHPGLTDDDIEVIVKTIRSGW